MLVSENWSGSKVSRNSHCNVSSSSLVNGLVVSTLKHCSVSMDSIPPSTPGFPFALRRSVAVASGDRNGLRKSCSTVRSEAAAVLEAAGPVATADGVATRRAVTRARRSVLFFGHKGPVVFF